MMHYILLGLLLIYSGTSMDDFNMNIDEISHGSILKALTDFKTEQFQVNEDDLVRLGRRTEDGNFVVSPYPHGFTIEREKQAHYDCYAGAENWIGLNNRNNVELYATKYTKTSEFFPQGSILKAHVNFTTPCFEVQDGDLLRVIDQNNSGNFVVHHLSEALNDNCPENWIGLGNCKKVQLFGLLYQDNEEELTRLNDHIKNTKGYISDDHPDHIKADHIKIAAENHALAQKWLQNELKTGNSSLMKENKKGNHLTVDALLTLLSRNQKENDLIDYLMQTDVRGNTVLDIKSKDIKEKLRNFLKKAICKFSQGNKSKFEKLGDEFQEEEDSNDKNRLIDLLKFLESDK